MMQPQTLRDWQAGEDDRRPENDDATFVNALRDMADRLLAMEARVIELERQVKADRGAES